MEADVSNHIVISTMWSNPGYVLNRDTRVNTFAVILNQYYVSETCAEAQKEGRTWWLFPARPQLSIELTDLLCAPLTPPPRLGFSAYFLSKIGQQHSSNTYAHSAPQPIMLTLSCAPENRTRRPELPALCSIFHICMLKPSEPCHPAAVSVKRPLLPSLHHTVPTVPCDAFHHLRGRSYFSCPHKARTPSSHMDVAGRLTFEPNNMFYRSKRKPEGRFSA